MKTFFKKTIKFLLLGIIIYFIVCLIASPAFIRSFYKYDWREKMFIQDSLSLSSVDVLTLGSSHVSSTFDPRVFKERGYQLLNLASPSQSPQNSYYILKDFFDGVLSKPDTHPIPKVIIHELYCKTLTDRSVLEPYVKTVENYPSTYNYLDLALQIGDMHAINMYISTALKRTFNVYKENKDFSDMPAYIHFGYYNNNSIGNSSIDNNIAYICAGSPSENQLKYLKKIIKLSKSYAVPIVFVIAPMPQDFTSPASSYSDTVSKIALFSKENGVLLINDFSSIDIDEKNEYVDSNHLNNSGARKVSNFVIQKLENLGFLKNTKK